MQRRCKAWVSYAQMEKRHAHPSSVERFERCRAVLQRGLTRNPTSACLVQVGVVIRLVLSHR
jgi:hypothetical protein